MARFKPAPRLRPVFVTLSAGLVLAFLAPQALKSQQSWAGGTQYPGSYPGSPYVQAAPNYVQYAPGQQPAYPQQPYGQQNPYAQQQGYPQQQQYAQQPYADPSQTGPAQTGPAQPDPNQYDPQQDFGQQPAPAQPFAAEQLEQLVAPIALYPDTLVAQILAASTYPAQVVAADNWLRSQGYASPDQIAYGASAQTNWDPSIKALTAFPQVLAMMNRDLRWTTDLGNAYYNQPQDVLQTIQVMRQRAQSAGTLRSTPQEQVSYNQGYIQLTPPNPEVVYVPAYNPWAAYGQPVAPYPGFSFGDALGAIGSFLGPGLRFGAGIGLAAFSHTPFGWAGWVLNWLASSIFFHQSPYISHSTTVAHFGGYGGGFHSPVGGINRRPAGFDRQQEGYNRFGNGYADRSVARPPVREPENYAYNRGVARGLDRSGRDFPESYTRPAFRQGVQTADRVDNFNHPQRAIPARPGGFANSYAETRPLSQPRPMASYGGSQFARPPANSYQRNDFAQHSYAEPRSYSGERGYQQAFRSPEHSGGFHMFGGGHGESSHGSFHEPKAPKAPKMSGGGHHSGGGHSGHHGR
ncbi:MAG: DUF3300 domain-containing protein [Terracidiphilus sp.]